MVPESSLDSDIQARQVYVYMCASVCVCVRELDIERRRGLCCKMAVYAVC